MEFTIELVQKRKRVEGKINKIVIRLTVWVYYMGNYMLQKWFLKIADDRMSSTGLLGLDKDI